jgi:triphosphoribosyl-dephospho-CoA synthetase
MKKAPDDTEVITVIRKSVLLPSTMWEAVADYRFSRRIGSEAEAVRRLVEAGVRAENARAPKPRS